MDLIEQINGQLHNLLPYEGTVHYYGSIMFKHKKTKETISKVLQHGSLLIMKGTTQSNWLHRLPPTKKDCIPRVNLTFRTIVEV